MINIIIPTLGNREFEFKRLLESLIVQENSELKVILVVQDNWDIVSEITNQYENFLDITKVEISKKGLSHARNIGLKYCTKGIVTFSDDDCWYPPDIFEYIEGEMNNIQIGHFQIKDIEKGVLYKEYSINDKILHKSKRMSFKISSIELFINLDKVELCDISFDERFGLGAKFPGAEEIILAIDLIDKGYILVYIPKVVVYHKRYEPRLNNKNLEVKGAFVRRNFTFIYSIAFISAFVFKKRHYLENILGAFYSFYKGYFRLNKKGNR